GTLVNTLAVTENVDDLVDAMYWSACNRPASEKEKDVATKFVKSAPAPASTQPVEVVWLDDALPIGVTRVGNWKFAGSPDQPVFSGKTSHTEAEPFPGQIQHLFIGSKFAVGPKD